MKNIILGITLGAVLTGCVAPTPAVQRVPFPEAEYAALAKRTGTGVVTGQAFLKTRGGDVKYGAGEEVYLQPATSYSDQWFNVNYLGQQTLADGDPRSAQGRLATQSDGTGSFTFKNVPPGDYYVSTAVTWQAPTQLGLATQGGVVAKKISVTNDAETKVILTR